MSVEQQVINPNSKSKSFREMELGSFGEHPLEFRGDSLNNLGAFVQAIKYGKGTLARKEVVTLSLEVARRWIPRIPPRVIEWEGKKIGYKSLGHYTLQAAAIFASFEQNEQALEAMLATGNLPIVYESPKKGDKNTALPLEVLANIIMEVRSYFFWEMGTPLGNDPKTATYITPKTVAYSRWRPTVDNPPQNA